MNPVQLLQAKLELKFDGIIGKKTFDAMQKEWNLNGIQLAHFLGQCDHETGGFRIFEENLRYSKEALMKVFPNRYNPEKAKNHEYKAQLIGNTVYGNRMGNVNPNDGFNFRGRGCIQLTGRNNYTQFAEWVKDMSIIDSPGQVADKYAFDSAIWFFQKNNIFKLCEDISEKNIGVISKAVNLGNPFTIRVPNGLKDRIEKTIKYSKFI